MESDLDLNFMGSNPGAVKFGNFINYYTFHSASDRLKYLTNSMFPNKFDDSTILCMDVGCNTGELTKGIFQFLTNLYPCCEIIILAVDIDMTLIERALENQTNANIIYKCLNAMLDKDRDNIKHFLSLNKKNRFDITFCFSLTMWIHLNYGDEGLKKFLLFIMDYSNTIILEPQPWSCYRNAHRRMKKAGYEFEFFREIKIKHNIEENIEHIVTKDSHIKVAEHLAPWKRKIISFKRISS